MPKFVSSVLLLSGILDSCIQMSIDTKLTIKTELLEMQIKTTVTYHLTPITMATVKKQEINAAKDVEKLELLCRWEYTVVQLL